MTNREDKNKLLQNKEFIWWLLSPSDESPWNSWYTTSEHNRLLADELREELRAIPFTSIPNNEVLRERIRTRITTSIGRPRRNTLQQVVKWSVAAVLVGIAATTALILNGKQSVVAGNGQQLSIALPDGSMAKINAGSTLSYNTFLWKFSPGVRLNGEGYFYGNHSNGFDVKTAIGKVTVLGTRFNVYSRNETYRVNCFQGLISVGIKGQSEMHKLTAGQSLSANLRTHKVTLSSINYQKPSWTAGEFYFDKVLFKDVLSELERQFGITFENKEKFENLSYTGYFNTKDINIAFKMTLAPMGISYKATKDHVILTKE